MTIVETSGEPLARGYSRVQWGPAIAGAIGAAALASVLEGFALAVGLSVSSTAPTWRDASFALVLTSGLYLLLAALVAYAFGGYIAGRLREPVTAAQAEASEFRDGMHGLIVWGIGTLLAGLLALATAQAATRLAAPSGGSPGPAASVGGENLIAFDLDRLFRGGERRNPADLTYSRAEAARILFTASSHRGLQPDDRTYLAQLVASTTGAAPADAQRRVDDVITRANENISRARRSAVVFAFMAAAAALLGALAAWFAAVEGGRHRDSRADVPIWLDWGRVRTRNP